MYNHIVKHGRSKLISNYGGVGSLIETQDCSVIIETFDNWQYDQLQNRLSTYIINDDRLLNRLRNRFPNLSYIIQIPSEGNTFADHIQPTSNYFPKWFYCSKCDRFADYDEWKRRWGVAGKHLDYFNPPKCSNVDCKEDVLEQIRFLMTCKDGHIHDIPWRHWNLRLPQDDTLSEYDDSGEDNAENEILKGPQLDFSRLCCDEQDLQYKISQENTELSGLTIKCKNCGNRQSLRGVFNFETMCQGKKHWLGMSNGQWINENCIQKTKVVVKTSNSVYYANTLSSIFIPEMQQDGRLTNEIRVLIDERIDSGEFTKEEIIKNISFDYKIPKEIVTGYLEIGKDTGYIPEEVFREIEYRYFLKGIQPESNQLKFRLIESANQLFGFDKLIKFEKLKKITVQTSFTRQEPIDVDSILQQESEYKYNVKRQSVSKNNFETKYLPGIESYGEGILFVINKEKLNRWETQGEVLSRINRIKENANNSSWQYHINIAHTLAPRKILLHTLSHLIIRELQYVCGYPASSLQERLYINDGMHGFMVSAFDGTDGYLGGLANLCDNLDNFDKIIVSAINRAKDCSSDPICMESEGQGVSQLNLAACHSCSLLPEVSCELSNLFLDRKLLVDETFGYFK